MHEAPGHRLGRRIDVEPIGVAHEVGEPPAELRGLGLLQRAKQRADQRRVRHDLADHRHQVVPQRRLGRSGPPVGAAGAVRWRSRPRPGARGGAVAGEQRIGQAEQVADVGVAQQLGPAVDHVEQRCVRRVIAR